MDKRSLPERVLTPAAPLIILVTRSSSVERIVPRVLALPAGGEVTVRSSLPEALELGRERESLLVLDLKSVQDGLEDLLRELIRGCAPPALVLGEAWNLPPWLKDRLGPRLVFLTYPLNPPVMAQRFQELLALAVPRPRPEPAPSPASEKASAAPAASVEELVGRLEALLGERDA